MPDREVKTIQDLIFYQYAKIIAKSAMKTGDNVTAETLRADVTAAMTDEKPLAKKGGK